MVEYLRRKMRVKDVCSAWGAYTTKNKFIRRPSPSKDQNNDEAAPGDPHINELLKDRRDLSQAQLERIWQLGKR